MDWRTGGVAILLTVLVGLGLTWWTDRAVPPAAEGSKGPSPVQRAEVAPVAPEGPMGVRFERQGRGEGARRLGLSSLDDASRQGLLSDVGHVVNAMVSACVDRAVLESPPRGTGFRYSAVIDDAGLNEIALELAGDGVFEGTQDCLEEAAWGQTWPRFADGELVLPSVVVELSAEAPPSFDGGPLIEGPPAVLRLEDLDVETQREVRKAMDEQGAP